MEAQDGVGPQAPRHQGPALARPQEDHRNAPDPKPHQGLPGEGGRHGYEEEGIPHGEGQGPPGPPLPEEEPLPGDERQKEQEGHLHLAPHPLHGHQSVAGVEARQGVAQGKEEEGQGHGEKGLQGHLRREPEGQELPGGVAQKEGGLEGQEVSKEQEKEHQPPRS